jgi:hypothetical protein
MKPVMRQTARRAVLPVFGLLAVLLAVGLSSVSAYAYDGGAAANYADQYWQNYNGNYRTVDHDCTNFVSQALHAGGYSFVNAGQNSSDDHNWWYSWGWQPFHLGDSFSNSWVKVPDQYQFLYWNYPGGYFYGTRSGQADHAPPNGLSVGDVLYYDWNNDGVLDHAAIQVALQGYDPTNGWFGDLVDSHQNNHRHAIWTLEPYHASSEAATTVTTLMHIDPNNH